MRFRASILLAIALSIAGLCEAQQPKILISVDMEGIGALVRDQFGPDAFEYQKGRQLMTAEVNAAVEGCLEAGAGEIVVADAHGNAQNLIPDELHERAMLIRSFPRPLMQVEGIDESFSGVIFIGYHPMDGTPTANLSHTFMGGTIFEIKVNGNPVSESIFNAAVVGSMGVPVIMVAGDQNITKEAVDTFGPIETVQTKAVHRVVLDQDPPPEAHLPGDQRKGQKGRRANRRNEAFHLRAAAEDGDHLQEHLRRGNMGLSTLGQEDERQDHSRRVRQHGRAQPLHRRPLRRQ